MIEAHFCLCCVVLAKGNERVRVRFKVIGLMLGLLRLGVSSVFGVRVGLLTTELHLVLLLGFRFWFGG